MSVTPELEYLQFPKHYEYALVESQETKEIFYLLIDGGYKGFIERIAFDWFEGSNPPATRSTLKLIVDGFTRSFDYQIDLNKPYIFNPPIVAKDYIRFVVINRDVPYTASDGSAKTGGHYYQVLIDGVLARPKNV